MGEEAYDETVLPCLDSVMDSLDGGQSLVIRGGYQREEVYIGICEPGVNEPSVLVAVDGRALKRALASMVIGKRRVKERPILFSAPMVRALLAGTKTQTRRMVKPVRGFEHNNIVRPDMAADRGAVWMHGPSERVGCMQNCPYGQPGDKLWVRETHKAHGWPIAGTKVTYRADYPSLETTTGWTPSIHMRRVFSRITLELTSVRVERLQDISLDDCSAEGVEFPENARSVANFAHLWGSINGPDSWDANPWVWVLEFKPVGPKP